MVPTQRKEQLSRSDCTRLRSVFLLPVQNSSSYGTWKQLQQSPPPCPITHHQLSFAIYSIQLSRLLLQIRHETSTLIPRSSELSFGMSSVEESPSLGPLFLVGSHQYVCISPLPLTIIACSRNVNQCLFTVIRIP